jgi:lipid II:glycine glycyltransferase (peptidoglycan interpeptide bridge formation enzyme)
LIRRAREAGVECVHDEDLVHLAEWSAIYRETMERVDASDSYRFDAGYFRRMADELGTTLHLFMAFVHGRPAAGGLFTVCDGIVEAHLGGSREEFSAYSPVRIIDDTARRWSAGIGARVFHLGGGVGGRQDSLFQYKATFSKRRHQFATWQWIVNEDVYDQLCRQQRMEVPGHAGGTVASDDFFPAYRKPE